MTSRSNRIKNDSDSSSSEEEEGLIRTPRSHRRRRSRSHRSRRDHRRHLKHKKNSRSSRHNWSSHYRHRHNRSSSGSDYVKSRKSSSDQKKRKRHRRSRTRTDRRKRSRSRIRSTDRRNRKRKDSSSSSSIIQVTYSSTISDKIKISPSKSGASTSVSNNCRNLFNKREREISDSNNQGQGSSYQSTSEKVLKLSAEENNSPAYDDDISVESGECSDDYSRNIHGRRQLLNQDEKINPFLQSFSPLSSGSLHSEKSEFSESLKSPDLLDQDQEVDLLKNNEGELERSQETSLEEDTENTEMEKTNSLCGQNSCQRDLKISRRYNQYSRIYELTDLSLTDSMSTSDVTYQPPASASHVELSRPPPPFTIISSTSNSNPSFIQQNQNPGVSSANSSPGSLTIDEGNIIGFTSASFKMEKPDSPVKKIRCTPCPISVDHSTVTSDPEILSYARLPPPTSQPQQISTQFESTAESESNINRLETQQKPYNCGSIKELKLTNFMCFDDLLMKFGSELTVLHGRQTLTGKTAIIQAIRAGLGARFGREVVKVGTEVATVQLTLNNKFTFDVFNQANTESFEIEKYGEEIILHRTITWNGNSELAIQLVNGDWQFPSLDELNLLLKAFNISLENAFQFCSATSFAQLRNPGLIFQLFTNYILRPKIEKLTNELTLYKSVLEACDKNLEQAFEDIRLKKKAFEDIYHLERNSGNGKATIESMKIVQELELAKMSLQEQKDRKQKIVELISTNQKMFEALPKTIFDFMNMEYEQLLQKCKYKGQLQIDFGAGKFWFSVYPESTDELSIVTLDAVSALQPMLALSSIADLYAASCLMVVFWKYLPPSMCFMDSVDRIFDISHKQLFWENLFQLTEDYDCKSQFIFVTQADTEAFSQNKFRNFVLPESSIISELKL